MKTQASFDGLMALKSDLKEGLNRRGICNLMHIYMGEAVGEIQASRIKT